ncbi:MAG: LexA family protein [Chlamydiales bacterium]
MSPASTRSKSTNEIPLASSSVSAGFTSPAEDTVDQTLDLNAHLVRHPAATFFVRVSGNSMEGANIFSGDILVVDRSLQATSGKIVVAIVENEFTVKRLVKSKGKTLLVAENPAYPPIENNFEVWGVVTYIIHAAK